MSITWHRGVVVGVDGSVESMAALDWAARTADLHDAPLTILVAYSLPVTLDPGTGGFVGEVRDEARRVALAARARLGAHRPGGHDVEVVTQPGDAASTLSERSRSCDLVVVGRRGLGRFDRMVLGSTSSALAASSPGSVVVVPAGATTGDPRRVRVGMRLDDDPDVLAAAFAEADVRGCPLEVVHVVSADSAFLEFDPFAASWRESAGAVLADQVARWSEKYPRVTCSVQVRRGSAVATLLEDMTPDDLLVLGGRRHAPVVGRVLRSVPDAVLRTAPCPVLVVHARRVLPG